MRTCHICGKETTLNNINTQFHCYICNDKLLNDEWVKALKHGIAEDQNLTIAQTVFKKRVTLNIQGISVPKNYRSRIKFALKLIRDSEIKIKRPIMLMNNVFNQSELLEAEAKEEG